MCSEYRLHGNIIPGLRYPCGWQLKRVVQIDWVGDWSWSGLCKAPVVAVSFLSRSLHLSELGTEMGSPTDTASPMLPGDVIFLSS